MAMKVLSSLFLPAAKLSCGTMHSAALILPFEAASLVQDLDGPRKGQERANPG